MAIPAMGYAPAMDAFRQQKNPAYRKTFFDAQIVVIDMLGSRPSCVCLIINDSYLQNFHQGVVFLFGPVSK